MHLAFGADNLNVLRPVGYSLHEHAAQQVVGRIMVELEAELPPDSRSASVGSDDQSRPPFQAPAVVVKRDARGLARFDAHVIDTAPNLRTTQAGGMAERRAHGGVPHAQRARHFGQHLRQVELPGQGGVPRGVLVVRDVACAEDAAGCG
jgi:hypothetical protein